MNKIIFSIAFFTLTFTLSGCGSKGKRVNQYTFSENEQGIEVRENGNPVLFYQRSTKSIDGKFARNNYIHPLYSLDGDTLTEDFPADHPHQRGVFWAWHQILADSLRIADGWALKNFTTKVVEAVTSAHGDTAIIRLHTLYESPLYENGKPYLEEKTLIKIHRPDENLRIIDFEITLDALIPRLSLGGSEDEKGYGGFSVRMRMPDSLKFLSQNGYVKPQTLQIKAGPWMDFSAPFGKNGEISGITLYCGHGNPAYPQPWIIRQKGSMQNIVWPGQFPVEIPENQPLTLHYRLAIHRDAGEKEKIIQWLPSF